MRKENEDKEVGGGNKKETTKKKLTIKIGKVELLDVIDFANNVMNLTIIIV